MLQLEFLNSVDPAMRLLRSSSHELFERPFSGYALLLFGAADEGVATWFARSLVSIDSLTGDDIACFIFAKKVKLHVSGTRTNSEETYDLSRIHRAYSFRPLVHEAISLWRPSDREINVTTYDIDYIARELSVTDRLPCIVFFDAALCDSPGLNDIRSRSIAGHCPELR